MARLVFILQLFISSLAYSQIPNYKSCFIIGDNVNIRKDTGLNSLIVNHASYGEEFRGFKINDDWYKIGNRSVYGFVSCKYITDPENFLKLAEAKINKNGITLLALENIYKNARQYKKAENLSLDIINKFINQQYLDHDENCPIYGETAFYNIVYYEKNNVDTLDPYFINYCKRVIAESKDSFIIVRAMIQLAGAYFSTKKTEDAKTLVLNSLKDFNKYIILRGTCPNGNNWISTNLMDVLIERIFMFPDHLSNEMNKICYDNKVNIVPKAIACDLLELVDYKKDYW